MKSTPDIDEIHHDLTRGARSAVAVLAEFEARGDLWEPQLGIYVHRARERALAEAAEVDRRLAAGDPVGPLAGVPVGVKDIVRTHDAPTTGQSLVSPWASPGSWGADAAVVTRLRAAGAVVTGKTTTLEHALGFSDPDKGFPLPRNPWNPERWTGGSSSGSGSGLAVGAFAGAVGTDTAGSIRMPAAWCGVTGLKPTYEAVPRSGVLPLSWSLDHVGPMARSARDCARLLSVMTGRPLTDRDASDPASLAGLRVGVLGDAVERATPEVRGLLHAALEDLAAHGAEIVQVKAPHHDAGIAATMLTLAAEAFALHRSDLASRWHDFSRATRAATLTGLMTSAADLVQISRIRRHLVAEVDDLLEQVDVLVGPTASTTAPDLASLDFGEVVASMQTVYWNATGHPALSLPAGRADGMPVGIQAVGRRHADHWLLQLGEHFQTITTHHLEMPEVPRELPVSDPRPAAPTSASASADPHDLERLSQLLRSAGVTPEPDEIATAAASWPSLRATLGELWRVPLEHGTEPLTLPHS